MITIDNKKCLYKNLIANIISGTILFYNTPKFLYKIYITRITKSLHKNFIVSIINIITFFYIITKFLYKNFTISITCVTIIT